MSDIQWQGDLKDDCSARWEGMLAHVECMGECRCIPEHGEEFTEKDWFCAVYRGDEALWHSSEHGGVYTSGELARQMCEAVMRYHHATAQLADAEALNKTLSEECCELARLNDQRWIPVEDTWPKHHEPCLVIRTDYGDVSYGYRAGCGWCDQRYGSVTGFTDSVTHWQPLPAPPKDTTE